MNFWHVKIIQSNKLYIHLNLISAILVGLLLPNMFTTSFLALRDYQDAVLSIGQISSLLQINPIIDSQSTDGQTLVCLHTF